MITIIEQVITSIAEYFEQPIVKRNTFYQLPIGSKADCVRIANLLRKQGYQVDICNHDFYNSIIISINEEVKMNEIEAYVLEVINYFNQKHHCSQYQLKLWDRSTATKVANLLRSGGYTVKLDLTTYLPTVTATQSKNIIPKYEH